jgi:glycine oxidase
LELVERGVAVNVVDAERAGGAATGASAGMLAPQYESGGQSPLYDLLVESRAAWIDFAGRVADLAGRPIPLRWNGMLVANWDEAEAARARADVAWQRAAGRHAEILDPRLARATQGSLGSEAVSFLWLPEEGQVDSQALAAALPDALAATPARVLTGRRVEAIDLHGDRASGVRLEDGRTLAADAVVIAAGAWSGRIGGLPRPLPVRPVRGHMVRYPPGSASLACLLASHAGRYLVPRNDGSILAGSTMDEVGFDRSLDDAGLADIRRSAARLLPELGRHEPVERWADLRPMTPDTFPIIGPDPDLDGLVYATGYGRNGILLGPVSGRIVADAVLGETPTHDLSPFAPDRFDAHPAAEGSGP